MKFTGMQDKWGIGALLTNDEAAGLEVPPTDPLYGEAADVSAVRVFRDYGDQSRAGFMHTELEHGDYRNRVSAADTYLKLTENWLTELLMVNTKSRTVSRRLGGRRTGVSTATARASTRTTIGLSRAPISTCRSVSWAATTCRTREGLHGFMEYRFWPEDSWMDRIGPRVLREPGRHHGLAHLQRVLAADANHLGRDSSFNVGTNSIEERLRPQDFAGLTSTRDYSQRRYFVNFATDSLQVRLFRRLRQGNRHQSRAAARCRARARRSHVYRSRAVVAADGSLARRHVVPFDGARGSRGTRHDFTDRIVRTLELQFTKRCRCV